MAQEPQEQLSPEANEQAEMSEGTTDYPKVQTPDQSEVPHHPAADPTQSDPNQEQSGGE